MSAPASLVSVVRASTIDQCQKREVFAELDGEPMSLVPPGEYQLRFDYHATAVMFGRAQKLILWFTVITMGPHFGKRLPRFYNVKLIGRPCKWGRFKASWSGNFVREYMSLFTAPVRLDRMSMTRFENHIIVGKVRTVGMGRDQKPIPKALHYSVIEELVRVEQ